MKTRKLLAVVCAMVFGMQSGYAADRWWDGGTTDIGTDGNGASAGTAGNWNTTLLNWDAGAAPHVAWTNANNDTAIFGGTAGTVTLTEGITVGGITFDTASSYTIAGSTLTLADGSIISVTPSVGYNSTEPVISSVLSGTNGFTKTGVGALRTSSTSSSLSGDIQIQQGTLYTRHEALGTGSIVFTGNSTLVKIYGADGSFPATMGVTVNPGVSATITGGSFYYNANFAGNLSGDTTTSLTVSPGGNVEFQFNNTANTFQGQLTISGGGTADNGGRGVFKSLADSSQKVRISNSLFRLANGGVAMNFANRQLEILDSARLDNDSATASVTMTFAKDLIATIGNNAKTLILSGVNTGTNTFAGKIANSATGTGAVSVQKDEAGKWILAGTNTYTGGTTISAGTLEIGGSGCLGSGTYVANISNAGTLIYNSSANQTFGGVISGAGSLIKDNSGTLSLTNANTYSGDTTVLAGTLSLGNGTANSRLSDAAKLAIAVGAVVNLNYSGSDTVWQLNLDGSRAAAGTWGATGSGASNIDNTHFTGSGVINNLGGAAYYWDGGTIDIAGDGNGASAGGNGTWNTTTLNWDVGVEPHVAWGNSSSDRAFLAGTLGTVTLGENVNIRDLTITANSSAYTIRSNTLNFATGGSITVNSSLGGNYATAATISSAITGSPSVVLNPAENTETDFLPAAGSMQLGAKTGAGLTALGGSTTGNTLASATGKIRVFGGEWTLLGNASGYQHFVDGGTFIVNGQLTSNSRELKISTNATLVAIGTIGSGNANGVNFNGNTEGASTGPGGTLKGTGTVNQSNLLNVRAEATIAPGYPTGTLTITNCDCTINGKLAITVNGNQVSTLAMHTTKTLTISNAKLDVNVTATPSTPVTIATYGVGKLTGTFLSNNMPNGWTIDYAANGGKAIVLTPPAAGTVILFR